MSELTVLRTTGLKGRVPTADLAQSLGEPESEVAGQVEQSVAAGHLKEMPTGLKLTPEGKERLSDLLAEERAGIDAAAMTAVYDDFIPLNTESKEVFTHWQVRPDGEVNDHQDEDYDAEVLDRLTAIHGRILAVVESAATLVPRAKRYAERLVTAQEKYASGDAAYVTRPIIDSYHTVWFELHEELIGWAGLTRAEEAAAGRGA